MRISARNQLLGSVVSVQRGAVNDEVVIGLAGGLRIVAVVTHESVGNLGLVPGATAFALIKASSVILLAGDGSDLRISTRNKLPGTVSEVKRGAVNAEVSIDVTGSSASGAAGDPPGTVVVTAIITNTSLDQLELAPGKPATALFKASSVMLGVDDGV
jgi:molybdate transport system regulatory protein